MTKKLITHINPHLDDIAAIWLLKKYLPDFANAEIDFISADNQHQIESDDLLFVGVGRGKYDEHKGDVEDCATSLVWKDLLSKNLSPQDQNQKKAVDELVEWSRVIDLGRYPEQEFSDFIVPAFIRPSDNTKQSSLDAVELGEKILDRILEVLIKKQRSLSDWQNKIEFDSLFGKAVAVSSQTINRAFCKANGDAVLYLMVDPVTNHVQYFTPEFDIDLEPIYLKLKQLDPQADWFLHQSHHMVICGSGSSPDSKTTDLSFEQLIELAKKDKKE